PAPAAAADRATARAAAYLTRAQNADGGFGPALRTRSTALYTAWAAMGLSAAGRRPARIPRDRTSIAGYLRRSAAGARRTGDVERTVLALVAWGLSPRRSGGTDLVARLRPRDRRDGSFGGLVNLTAFGVLALRAAGDPASGRTVRRCAAWIARQQNRDGGFGFSRRGAPSGIDDTAAAVQALAAAGHRRSGAIRRAAAFLVRRQNRDGGLPLTPGSGSNAQSTAWAVQALVAAGRDPDRVRRGGSRTPLGYLRTLVGSDGAVRYSRTSRQTPVWVTAQALTALARRPFPIRPGRSR
ncbi:MAG: prenyltransferase/squalene oxidase repeat-containing protein, partial [Solirubrobacteraceae bacterium]